MLSFILTTIGQLLLLYIVFRAFRYLFGTRVLVALYPRHYSIWNGTQPVPKPPLGKQLSLIWRVLRSKNPAEDILDGLFTESTVEVGRTFARLTMDYVTVEPANIQAILATQFKDFETGWLRRAWLRPLLGDSIFTSDGSFWEHSRALFRPQFARDNINDLEATSKAADALIAACGPANDWTGDINLSPLFYNFTLDTATEFLFGESINSLGVSVRRANNELEADDADAAAAIKFARALETLNECVLWRMRLGPWYFLADGAELRAAAKHVKDWTEPFVQLALNSTPAEQAKKANILSSLATQCRSPEELRNQTLAILFAGRDTTASLLGWIFTELALHPEIYQKLRDTILAELPADGGITFSQLKSCRYLQHVINESLRLHPTVPINMRFSTKDTTLPVGGGPDRLSPIAVPKGHGVFFSVYTMHRRTDLWGEDALEFKPERWEQRYPAWQFLPFLGGPRICLGQQFALTEAGYLLVKLLRHFDRMEPVDAVQMARMRKTLGVTMSVRDGVRVRLHRARLAEHALPETWHKVPLSLDR